MDDCMQSLASTSPDSDKSAYRREHHREGVEGGDEGEHGGRGEREMHV